MGFNFNRVNFLLPLIIIYSIIPQIISVLSFTYPQSTTLKNKNILIVEKNGIYICDPNFDTILSTLYSFSDEDKITTQSKLSTTIIKKSSFAILILTNYKLYIIRTTTGELLYQNDNKIIQGEEPEYVDLAYVYTKTNDKFYFTISYINSSNYLKIFYYEFFISDNSISFYNSCSLNSVTRAYSGSSYTFNIQNKGISCDNVVDDYNSDYSYITCFVIGKIGRNDYLIPITFDDGSSSISFVDSYYTMGFININNVMQIKTDTNGDMDITYVCYVTEQNLGECYAFYLDRSYKEGYFSSSKITFPKSCRAEIYGMKVSYIFETGKVLFSCSDLDGSLQVKIFGEEDKYYKFDNCIDINGFSIIFLDSLSNYFVTSDVTCPEGLIPFDILINSGGFTPELIPVPANKQITTENFEQIRITNKAEISTIKTDKISEIQQESTILKEKVENEKISTILDNINKEMKETTQLINNDITEKTNDMYYCPEMCLECNSEEKCIKCNKEKGYYPVEITSIEPGVNPSQKAVECVKEDIKETKFPNFYFDPESESFKPCYENCATCYGKGDGNNNNCKTCEPGYILHPEYDDPKDCVPKPNSLYYIKYGQYTITNSDQCPEDFNFLIQNKSKCIEDCKKDSKYMYTYDGLCYEEPPENTNDEDGDFICKDNPEKCIVTRKKLYTLNDTITDLEVEILIFKYATEYSYTNNHISIYENNIYIITIFKNGECISELGILSKMIDFGDCYTNIHTKNSIDKGTNLIVAQIETKPGKEAYKKNPSYGLYHPTNGRSLHYETECKDQKITIQNNLTQEFYNNSKVNLSNIKLMSDGGIDLFDPTCPFYNDLCTHYPDILGKDIPLNKRALAYYPNIELCDDNCDLTSVFLKNLTANCECSISGRASKNDKVEEKSLFEYELGDFEEFIYLTNINVIKCYKDLFKQEYFVKCYGGFIILGLIFIQIFSTLIYCLRSRFYLKKYFFSITNKYLIYLKNKNALKNIARKPPMVNGDIPKKPPMINGDILKIDKISFPPRKANKSKTGLNVFIKKPNNLINNNLVSNNINNNNLKKVIPYDNSTEKININNSTKRNSHINTFRRETINFNPNNKIDFEQSDSDNLMKNIKDDFDIKIEEFLKTDPGDMDYDDAIRRDNRTVCRYYLEKIQTQQMILNTFCNKEYLKPMPIKIILLALQVELYFFINGLFYNEEYVTKLFELEKDSLADQTWRFLDNLFYAFLVGVIINYVIEFFFIQEKKLRVTLKREKNNLLILKYEMVQIVIDIQKRYLSFIIVSFIVSVFIWYHISCFNNVYKHMKGEWLVFSILIIVCIQLLSIVTSLVETILRFLSFRFKSEKLYKLSLIFS